MKKIFISVVLVLVLIQFYPKISLSTAAMTEHESDFLIYHLEDGDKLVYDEIKHAIDKDAKRIIEKLEFDPNEKTAIYIYPDQSVFHRKKYGA